VAYEDPRLLHRDSTRGYTSRPVLALPREPEAISEEEQVALSVRARAEFADLRRGQNERKDRQMWIDRLRKAEQRASDKGVDIFKPQAQIRQQILAMERMVDEAI
jgi:hypothetical protein